MTPLLLDLENIRRELFITLQEMAERLTISCGSPKLNTIPPTRVHEWERGVRSVPTYIYSAYAHVAANSWRMKRERVVTSKVMDVDIRYSQLINASIAPLLLARMQMIMHPKEARARGQIEEALEQIFVYYERLLDVDLRFCLATPARQSSKRKPSRRFPRGDVTLW